MAVGGLRRHNEQSAAAFVYDADVNAGHRFGVGYRGIGGPYYVLIVMNSLCTERWSGTPVMLECRNHFMYWITHNTHNQLANAFKSISFV